MTRRIDRLVVRTVLVCAALAVTAFFHNHVTKPCAADEVGASGMCVSSTWAGGAR